MFNRRADYMPLDSRWFDITVWGGVLVVTAYAMGTLVRTEPEEPERVERRLRRNAGHPAAVSRQPEKQRSRLLPRFVLCDQDCRGTGPGPGEFRRPSNRRPAAKRERNRNQQRDSLQGRQSLAGRARKRHAQGRERRRDQGPGHGWIAAPRDSNSGGGPAVARDRRQSSRLRRSKCRS